MAASRETASSTMVRPFSGVRSRLRHLRLAWYAGNAPPLPSESRRRSCRPQWRCSRCASSTECALMRSAKSRGIRHAFDVQIIQRPAEFTVERRVPASPLIIPISAWLKIYSASTGVCRGSSALQGPNFPAQSISPFGIGFVRTAWKDAGLSKLKSLITSS